MRRLVLLPFIEYSRLQSSCRRLYEHRYWILGSSIFFSFRFGLVPLKFSYGFFLFIEMNVLLKETIAKEQTGIFIAIDSFGCIAAITPLMNWDSTMK